MFKSKIDLIPLITIFTLFISSTDIMAIVDSPVTKVLHAGESRCLTSAEMLEYIFNIEEYDITIKHEITDEEEVIWFMRLYNRLPPTTWIPATHVIIFQASGVNGEGPSNSLLITAYYEDCLVVRAFLPRELVERIVHGDRIKELKDAFQ